MEDICFTSATQLIRAIHDRELSAQEVVAAFQERLETVNPRLNAVTVVAEDALERARLADQKQARASNSAPCMVCLSPSRILSKRLACKASWMSESARDKLRAQTRQSLQG